MPHSPISKRITLKKEKGLFGDERLNIKTVICAIQQHSKKILPFFLRLKYDTAEKIQNTQNRETKINIRKIILSNLSSFLVSCIKVVPMISPNTIIADKTIL